MPFCTECGAENPKENKFCSECGSPLKIPEAPDFPNPFEETVSEAPAASPEPAQEAPAASAEPVLNYTKPSANSQPSYSYNPPTSPQASAPTMSAEPVAPIPTGGLLAWSIVSILLCLIPGIVALVMTLGINKCVTVEEQEKKAKNAKIWCIVATVLGVLAIIGRLANGS